MGYEDAISTKLLATTCAICGLPLRDPASIERGVGPECWQKYFLSDRPLPAAVDLPKLRAALELAPEPLKGRWREVGGDLTNERAPWAADPETRRKMVSLGLHHAAIAASYGSNATETIARGVDTAKLTITVVQNFAAGAGYQNTADRMAKAYGEKLEEQVIAFVRPDPKRPTTLAVHAPPNETWKGIARKNHAIFFQSEWKDGRFFRYFHERDLRKVVNMLQGVFGDAYCFNPEGDLILLPAMPMQEEPPAPPGDAPKPKKATGALPSVPKEMDEIKLGEEVTLPNGDTSFVQFIDPKKRRIGVGPRKRRQGEGVEEYSYLFFSYAQIEEANGKKVAEAIADERKRADRAEGFRSDPDRVILPRDLPAGLKPYQLDTIDFIEKHGRVIVALDPGLGKAQPLDAKVLTPSGWSEIGSLKVGDLVVDPDTGHAAPVTGVFPRGIRDCYRVTLSDGSSTRCCDEHLWLVHTKIDRSRNKPARVMELRAFASKLDATYGGSRQRNYYIPVCAPVAFDDPSPLPLRPYLMGVLLGNGSFRNASPRLSQADEEVVDRIRSELPSGVVPRQRTDKPIDYELVAPELFVPGTHSNPLTVTLAQLGLMGKLSIEKHVPPEYLRASADDRLALLRGLMDTDGDCTPEGTSIFNTSSPWLRDNVVELVRSLGGVCTVYEKEEPTYIHNDERRIGHPAWRVNIRLSVNPFFLKRKAKRWKPGAIRRAFESVERIGRAEMACISVASKRNLYITDDYVVTHNTASAIVAIDPPAICIVPALIKVNWVREIALWRPSLSTLLVQGSKHPPKELLSADVVILNYEIVEKHLDWLTKFGAKTLIADEAQALKTFGALYEPRERTYKPTEKTSNRARAFYELHWGIPKILFLTATPIMNRVKELWPMLHMANKQEWGNQKNFQIEYCAAREVNIKGRRVWDANGRSNTRDLHQRLVDRYMIRRTKAEVAKDLPPKSRESIAVSMDLKHKKLYARVTRDFLNWIEEQGGPDALNRAGRAEALVRMTAMRRIAANGKAPAAIEWIKTHWEGTQRPLVVMGVHRDALEKIAAGIDQLNAEREAALAEGEMPEISKPIRYGYVIGGMSEKTRQKSIDDFQKNGTLDLLLYSIKIATGTTLTRATEMLFIERLWRPADQVQAEDRIHRIGSTEPVQITYLDAEGTIDGKIAMLLQDKSVTAAAVIDGVDLSAREAADLVYGEMFGFDPEQAYDPSEYEFADLIDDAATGLVSLEREIAAEEKELEENVPHPDHGWLDDLGRADLDENPDDDPDQWDDLIDSSWNQPL